MFKHLLLTLPLVFTAVSAVNAEESEQQQREIPDYQVIDWSQPDCSSYSSFRKCQNDIKLEFRRKRQAEMQSHNLSFDYFERPSFTGKEVGQALKDKVSGALVIQFDVLKDGSTDNVQVAQASSDEVTIFADSIIDAIKLWKFIPVTEKKVGVEWSSNIFFEPEECKKEPKEGVEKVDCYVKD